MNPASVKPQRDRHRKLLKKFQGFFLWASLLGVRKAPPVLRSKIKLTNISAISYGLLHVALFGLYTLLGDTELSKIAIVGAVFFIALPLTLNYFGHFNLSRFLGCAIGAVIVVLTELQNDISSLVVSCLVLCIVFPFLIFRLQERRMILLSLLIPITGYSYILFSQFSRSFTHQMPHNAHTLILEVTYFLITTVSLTVSIYTSMSAAEVARTAVQDAEAQLVLSAKLATLGTAAAAAGHDINNCLNFMNSSVQSLKRFIDAEEDPERKAKAEKTLSIMTQGLKMSMDIVSNLRSHSHVLQTDSAHVDLKNSINGILQMLHTKTIDCEVLINIHGRGVVYGNETGINQSIMNIIANALDAVNEYSTTKMISIEVSDVDVITYERVKGVQIRIKDNGPGISEELQGKIFNPFFTTKTTKNGTGLGLFISKKEIAGSHGSLKLISAPGSGSEFVITLPSDPLNFEKVS